MKNEPRKHHYISQFYLKGFGKSGSKKKPPITVINLQDKKYFTTTSNNLANIRDFNRINVPNLKPDAIETALSDFEVKAADAIREIHKTKTFKGENRDLVLLLVAMFQSRNPAQRENRRNFMSRVFQHSSSILLHHDDEFKKKTDELAEILELNDTSTMSTEKLNRLIFDNTKLELLTEYHLYNEFILTESIFNALSHRKWTLVQASEQTGPIITSDNPVILCWNNPESIPPFYRQSPGHAKINTTVYFSLSQHLSLIGIFDGDDAVAPPNENLVAVNNTMNIIYARHQIYSPSFHLRVMDKNEEIRDGNWLKEIFKLTKK